MTGIMKPKIIRKAGNLKELFNFVSNSFPI